MGAVVRGIRGATTLDEDTQEQVYKRVQALVTEMISRNGLVPDDIISMIFTATDDVTAAFPATAARALGLSEVPLLGAREMPVPGDPPYCIRVLAHVYTELNRSQIAHVYLEGAVGLRPDLASWHALQRSLSALSSRPDAPAGRAQVVGLGLIGSSLGLALRAAGWHVTGEDADPLRALRTLELDAVDDLGRDRSADLAFVATPVSSVPAIAHRLLAAGSAELVVSDVGGVKGPVVAAVDHPRFVGGHPMAGSEQEGPDGADSELFSGATWVLTPTAQTDHTAYTLVRSTAVSLGAEVLALQPERHDALVAVVSHVPHLTAATLMALAADASVEQGALLRLAAGGFRDMTRIAAGSPAIWPDVFRDNAGAVLGVLDDLLARIGEARRIVAEGSWVELVALLEHARHARRNLPPRIAAPEQLAELRVPVADRAGVLAEVTTLLGGLGVNVADVEIAHSAEGDRGVLVLAVDAGDADKARAALAEHGYRPALRRLQ